MFIVKAYAEPYIKGAREVLANGRAGRTRAGRANGQTAAAEREALNFMTPQQIQQSANRYQRRRASANR